MRESRRPTHLLTLGHRVSFIGEPYQLNGPTRNFSLNKVWAHARILPVRSSAYMGHRVFFIGEPQRLNRPTQNSGLNKVWAHTKSSPARSSAYTGPPRVFRRQTTQVEWAYMDVWSKNNLGSCKNLAGQPICSLWAITFLLSVNYTS